MYLIFSEAPAKLVATAVDQFPDSAAQGFETGALLNQHDYFHNDHDEDFHVDHNDSIGFLWKVMFSHGTFLEVKLAGSICAM